MAQVLLSDLKTEKLLGRGYVFIIRYIIGKVIVQGFFLGKKRDA